MKNIILQRIFFTIFVFEDVCVLVEFDHVITFVWQFWFCEDALLEYISKRFSGLIRGGRRHIFVVDSWWLLFLDQRIFLEKFSGGNVSISGVVGVYLTWKRWSPHSSEQVFIIAWWKMAVEFSERVAPLPKLFLTVIHSFSILSNKNYT